MENDKITIQLNTKGKETEPTNKFVINGRIGEMTFMGNNLTLEKATAEYEQKAEIMDIFWKNCVETYYTGDREFTF